MSVRDGGWARVRELVLYSVTLLVASRYLCALIEGSIVPLAPVPPSGTLLLEALVALGACALVAIHMWKQGEYRRAELNELVKKVSSTSSGSVRLPSLEDPSGELGDLLELIQSRLVSELEQIRSREAVRKELLANVAHDLRGPLTSMQGYLETLIKKGDSFTKAEQHEFVEIALENTKFIVKLVDDLFALSRLEEGREPIWPEPFLLPELLQRMQLNFKSIATKKGISLELLIARDLPYVIGDITMLERALSNLIENAIYYTEPGGEVRVEAQSIGERVRVCVRDTGIGIPAQDLPHVFERFYRVNKDRSRETGGTGLGLAITKRILDVHGAPVSVRSTEHQGTQISFELERVLAS